MGSFRIRVWPLVLVMALTISAMGTSTFAASRPAGASSPTVFLPLVRTSEVCKPDELFQTSDLSRYLQFCSAPRVYWVVTNPRHPAVKVEWLLPEDPSRTPEARNLALSIPEVAAEQSIPTLALLELMVKTRVELTEAQSVSAQTMDELKAVAVDDSIAPQQIEAAVGLAFAGPPGWIVAGVIIAIAAAVVLYVVLKNTRQDFTTGKTIGEVFSATSDDAFSIDRLNQEIAEGTATTPYVAEVRDHYLEGSAARKAQAVQALKDAKLWTEIGVLPYCQHRPDAQGGTTVLWYKIVDNKWLAFFHRPADATRDTSLYRPRLHSYPRGGEKEYTDEPDNSQLCIDARAALLWRILCYLVNPAHPDCSNPPWNPLVLTQRVAYRHERPIAFA